MCLSRLGQVIYGVLAATAVGLCLASMFTTGWRQLGNSTDFENLPVKTLIDDPKTVLKGTNIGLFFCQLPNNTGAVTTGSNGPNATGAFSAQEQFEYCKAWFMARPDWEKAVIVGMILALGSAILAFVWNLLTFCACFCKGTITKPLPGLAGMTLFFLVISLGLFYYKNQSYIEELPNYLDQLNNSSDISQSIKQTVSNMVSFVHTLDSSNNRVSYSFYLACGAGVASLLNVVVGSLIVCMADKCL